MTKTGEAAQLTVSVEPADAANQKATWISSDPKVATVDENGKVTAVGRGTCTITVTTEDGNKTVTCKVTVNIGTTGSTTIIPGTTDTSGVPTADPGATDTPGIPTAAQGTTDTPDQMEPGIPPEAVLTKNALSLNALLKVSQTGKKINIAWGKITGADGYDVYVQYCGKKFSKKIHYCYREWQYNKSYGNKSK